MYDTALKGTEGLYSGAGALTSADANARVQAANAAATAGGLYDTAAGIGTKAGGLTSDIGKLNMEQLAALLGSSDVTGQSTSSLNAASGIGNTAANVYSNLPKTALTGTTAVDALAQAQTQTGAMPSTTFLAQKEAFTKALNDYMNAINTAETTGEKASNINTAANALPESVISLLQNILKLGTNASLGGSTLGSINTGNETAALSALGSIAGGSGLGKTLFGTGGLTSDLGLSSDTGLLGSLGNAVSDFSSATGASAGTEGASGILGFIGSLFL
jgi:hypothetical protein